MSDAALDDSKDLEPDELRALIDEARAKKNAAHLRPRDTKQRRSIEAKQRKGRVNQNLLRSKGPSRDEIWSIRARPDYIKGVKSLAEDLSEPGAKVSVAALMEEAMELLFEKYRSASEAGE